MSYVPFGPSRGDEIPILSRLTLKIGIMSHAHHRVAYATPLAQTRIRTRLIVAWACLATNQPTSPFGNATISSLPGSDWLTRTGPFKNLPLWLVTATLVWVAFTCQATSRFLPKGTRRTVDSLRVGVRVSRVVFRMRPSQKPARRHEFDGLAFAGPAKFRGGTEPCVVVEQLDVGGLAGLQVDLTRVGSRILVYPCVIEVRRGGLAHFIWPALSLYIPEHGRDPTRNLKCFHLPPLLTGSHLTHRRSPSHLLTRNG